MRQLLGCLTLMFGGVFCMGFLVVLEAVGVPRQEAVIGSLAMGLISMWAILTWAVW